MSHKPTKPAGSHATTDPTPDTNSPGGSHTRQSLDAKATTAHYNINASKRGLRAGEIAPIIAGKNVGYCNLEITIDQLEKVLERELGG